MARGARQALLVIVAAALLALLLQPNWSAQAMKYTVGGPAGWATGTDLESWVAPYTFHVGDELFFQYPYGQSSVLLVTEEDYKDCNTNHGIASDGGLGDMVMTLVSAETYYFISGHPDQCKLGLRLEVPVLEALSQPGTATYPPPPPEEEEHSTPPATTNIPSSPVILSPPRSINIPYSTFRPSASAPLPSLSSLLALPLSLALAFTYLASS